MDDLERFIRYRVTPDDVVIDVGANQGTLAMVFAQLASKVYCVEPNPFIFPLLKQNMSGTNATLLELAVSDHLEKVDFYLDKRPGMSGVGSSIEVLADLHSKFVTEKIRVDTTTIDDLCHRYDIGPTFIKVDVEGHEPAVFRGAVETLEKHRPTLLFEFWEAWWERGYAELFASLEDRYHLVRIQDGLPVAGTYRAERGQGIVDIAALPRRSAKYRGGAPRQSRRGWMPWIAKKRAVR